MQSGSRAFVSPFVVMVSAFAATLPPVNAKADAVADFYKGKTVEIYIGYTSGGGYDVYARLLARHMTKHIPGNPNIIPKNMEGAGSLRAVNWLYNIAPKDGTVFGTFGRGAPFDPLLGVKAAQFDGTKFSWVGSMNDEVSVCVSWTGSGVNNLQDLLTKELVVGGTGPSADTDQFPKVMNGALGTKMKIISGYPGGNDINLAMQRGEVKGRCGWSWSSVIATHPDWYKDKSITVLIQLALHKHADLPDVPLVMDLAKNDEQRKILNLVFARQVLGRPFAGPPNIPADRLAALQKAFMETMADKDFLVEAERAQLEITPVSGEEIKKLVKGAYDVGPEIAKQTIELLESK